MGCSSCGRSSVTRRSGIKNKAERNNLLVNDPDCPYSIEQLRIWKSLLVCFREKKYFHDYKISPKKLNKCLGIVLSALNYVSYPCYFRKDLDEINELILFIIGTDKCQ